MHSVIESWTNTLTKLGVLSKKQSKRGRPYRLGRRLRIEGLESRQMLAIIVNVSVDEEDGLITDGDISLRDAILEAPDGETINFAPSLNGATISLLSSLGQIQFAKRLTIDASMLPDGLTIDASGADPTPTQNNRDGIRIFNIIDPTSGSSPPLITLKSLTLTGADMNGRGGAISTTAPCRSLTPPSLGIMPRPEARSMR